MGKNGISGKIQPSGRGSDPDQLELWMTYDGEMIAPLFCAVTAGSTRDGDEGYPYLKSVSCPDDEKAADFISFVSLSAKQAAAA